MCAETSAENNWGNSVSMVPGLQCGEVLTNSLSLNPRLDTTRTLCFKAHSNAEVGSLRDSVYSVHTSVHLPPFFVEDLDLKQLASAKLCWETCLLRHMSNGFTVFVASSSWGRLRQVPVPHDDELLWFDCTDQTNHTTAAQMHNWLHARTVWTRIVSDWVVLWMWMGCLHVLALRSPFNIGSAQENIDCEASSTVCVIVLAMWSHAPFGLFEHVRSQTFSCPSPHQHQWPNLKCVAYSATTVAFATHSCWLSIIQYSMSLNTDMNEIPLSKSCGFVDPKNVWIYLMIAVWPWKYVPMELHWSARDIIHVHECRRVPCFREFCRPCFVCKCAVVSHTKIQSRRIHVRLLPKDFL